MPVTIRDVASRCGLSVSTVSKAFNNYGDISSETRSIVLAAAAEIGYHPNAIARMLKTNRSNNLGVVFTEDMERGLTHSFFASLLNAFKRESEKNGYDITFINHNIGKSGMTFLEHCRYRNVDGVCVACTNFYSPEIVELMNSGIPVVNIDHPYPDRRCVLSDNTDGIRQLVKYAYDLGHRKIAYLYGQEAYVTDRRLESFFRATQYLGLEIPAEYVIRTRYDDPATCEENVQRLMTLTVPPTFILAPDDHAALGVLSGLKSLGLNVPQDVSVAGFDGTDIGQAIRPRLTTVVQDTDEMGRLAAISLINAIENPENAGDGPVTVPVKLLVGETTGRPGNTK